MHYIAFMIEKSSAMYELSENSSRYSQWIVGGRNDSLHSRFVLIKINYIPDKWELDDHIRYEGIQYDDIATLP